MENTKNQENKLRRALAAHGYALRKSRGFTGPDNLGGVHDRGFTHQRHRCRYPL